MTKKPQATIDDVLGAVADLATMVGEQFGRVDDRFEQIDQRFEDTDEQFKSIDQRFDQIDQRFDQIDQRFDRLEAKVSVIRKEQHDMRDWLERIDNRLYGIESDIKEIYDRIVALEQKSEQGLTPAEQRELSKKFEHMLIWAQKVSKATGVPLPKL